MLPYVQLHDGKMKVAQIFYERDHKAVNLEAIAGTVKVTQVSRKGISGTFDVTFENGSHIRGKYSAPNDPHFDPNG